MTASRSDTKQLPLEYPQNPTNLPVGLASDN